MAKQSVLVSDISGAYLEERDAAQIKVTYGDRRRGVRVIDVSAEEAEQLLGRYGTLQRPRGRRPANEQLETPAPEPAGA